MVHRWMLISALLVPGLAHAGLRGARETRCQIDVKLTGPIAQVSEVHDWIDDDDREPEASYDLALPAGAALTGARITPPGGREARAVLVSAAALATETPDAASLGIAPDLGVVTWLGGDADGERFAVRAAGLDPHRPLRVALTWTAAATYRGGRMVLAVPARGDDDRLAACAVSARASAGGGVRSYGATFINGVKAASASTAAVRALELEAVPTWAGDRPVAASSSIAVPGDPGDTRALTSVAIYLPPARQARFAPRRLLLVLDTSRSLDADGRAAVAKIADALIAAVGPATPVEAIGFDREARRLLGAWTPARTARAAIARGLADAVPGGGSDLGGALNLAAEAVADGDSTRVVIVTDGVLATSVDGAALIGHAMMPVSQVTVDAIVPLVPGAPLLARGALDALVTAFHGQVIAVRTSELPARAGTLARALAAAPPLRDLALTLDGADAIASFPDELAPGTGALVHVLARGQPVRAVHLTGTRSADAVGFDAVALPAGVAPIAAAAALAGAASLSDVAGLADDELLGLARAASAVTALTGLAVVDTSTPTGATRAELARTAGIFTRTTPPGGRPTEAGDRGAPAAAASAAVDVNLPASSYQLLIKYQLWPQIRNCYQVALQGKPRFAGTLDLTLELARGEVHDVRIGGTPMPEAMIACVAQAAYAMEVPRYPLAGLAETIAVVHKPVYLRAPIDADGEGELSEELGFPVAEPPPPPLD